MNKAQLQDRVQTLECALGDERKIRVQREATIHDLQKALSAQSRQTALEQSRADVREAHRELDDVREKLAAALAIQGEFAQENSEQRASINAERMVVAVLQGLIRDAMGRR